MNIKKSSTFAAQNCLSMKKLLIIACAILVSTFVCAQDIIITNDAKKIEAKVLEISETEIKYKEADDLEGPTYVLGIQKINSIVLSSGKVKTFGTTQPAPVQPVTRVQEPKPVKIDTSTNYLPLAVLNYLDGFPKNVVHLDGNYSMLYDKDVFVYFQFNYENAEVVQYGHNDKNIESYLGSLPEFRKNHASDFEGFDMSRFEKLACDKFNDQSRKKKCVMIPFSSWMNYGRAKQYLLQWNVEKMDVGSGVASALSVNNGTASGGVIMSGKITIYDLSNNEKVCTLYADRIKGVGSPHFHARIVNTLEELFGRQLFFIKTGIGK